MRRKIAWWSSGCRCFAATSSAIGTSSVDAVIHEEETSMLHRRFVAAAAFCLAASGALADDWPGGTVRIVNPFPAGGAADTVSRALAQRLQDQMRSNFIVENRTGAGGNVGSEVVAKAPPDGTMFLFGSDHLTISKALYPRLTYDTFKELVPIVLVSTGPHVLLAHP